MPWMPTNSEPNKKKTNRKPKESRILSDLFDQSPVAIRRKRSIERRKLIESVTDDLFDKLTTVLGKADDYEIRVIKKESSEMRNRLFRTGPSVVVVPKPRIGTEEEILAKGKELVSSIRSVLKVLNLRVIEIQEILRVVQNRIEEAASVAYEVNDEKVKRITKAKYFSLSHSSDFQQWPLRQVRMVIPNVVKETLDELRRLIDQPFVNDLIEHRLHGLSTADKFAEIHIGLQLTPKSDHMSHNVFKRILNKMVDDYVLTKETTLAKNDIATSSDTADDASHAEDAADASKSSVRKRHKPKHQLTAARAVMLIRHLAPRLTSASNESVSEAIAYLTGLSPTTLLGEYSVVFPKDDGSILKASREPTSFGKDIEAVSYYLQLVGLEDEADKLEGRI